MQDFEDIIKVESHMSQIFSREKNIIDIFVNVKSYWSILF